VTADASQPRRRALLLGCSRFVDPGLDDLTSPSADVRRLAEVLGDTAGSAYEVTQHLDFTKHEAELAVDEFLADANRRDTHLLYFSGHGVRDGSGNLYFAFADTRQQRLSSTGLAAHWIRECVEASPSTRTILLLDCCYSGQFLHGMRAKASEDANVGSLLADMPEGSGMAVLTASGRTGLSFEQTGQLRDRDKLSYFTEAIVNGIQTGAASDDVDGRITVDGLYEYVSQQLRQGPSVQRPERLTRGDGRLLVAVSSSQQRHRHRHLRESPHQSPSSSRPMLAAEAADKLPRLPPARAIALIESMDSAEVAAAFDYMGEHHAAGLLSLPGLAVETAAEILGHLADHGDELLQIIERTRPSRVLELREAMLRQLLPYPRPVGSPEPGRGLRAVPLGSSREVSRLPPVYRGSSREVFTTNGTGLDRNQVHWVNEVRNRIQAERWSESEIYRYLNNAEPLQTVLVLTGRTPVSAAKVLQQMDQDQRDAALEAWWHRDRSVADKVRDELSRLGVETTPSFEAAAPGYSAPTADVKPPIEIYTWSTDSVWWNSQFSVEEMTQTLLAKRPDAATVAFRLRAHYPQYLALLDQLSQNDPVYTLQIRDAMGKLAGEDT